MQRPKLTMYQDIVTAGMESCFPVITTRRKSTDLPWINNRIRRMVRLWRGIFRQEGRSQSWYRLKKLTDSSLIRQRGDRVFAV